MTRTRTTERAARPAETAVTLAEARLAPRAPSRQSHGADQSLGHRQPRPRWSGGIRSKVPEALVPQVIPLPSPFSRDLIVKRVGSVRHRTA